MTPEGPSAIITDLPASLPALPGYGESSLADLASSLLAALGLAREPNVLRLPAGSDFRFSYGPGSFRAHRAEAVRLGLPVRVLRQPDLAYDVDWPADVVELNRTS